MRKGRTCRHMASKIWCKHMYVASKTWRHVKANDCNCDWNLESGMNHERVRILSRKTKSSGWRGLVLKMMMTMIVVTMMTAWWYLVPSCWRRGGREDMSGLAGGRLRSGRVPQFWSMVHEGYEVMGDEKVVGIPMDKILNGNLVFCPGDHYHHIHHCFCHIFEMNKAMKLFWSHKDIVMTFDFHLVDVFQTLVDVQYRSFPNS